MDAVESPRRTTVLQREHSEEPRRTWRTFLVGRPLQSEEAAHQTIGKAVGLAVFASDALSSTAYASQEIMIILAAAGAAATHLVFPISIAIAVLLLIVTVSYQQTIHAYPGGGGAYIVARDNLGEGPAQTAGAALLTDYILTVSVSVSSGVAQLVSAYPSLYKWRVEIAVVMVLFIMVMNLRGVKESGTLFAIPTYFFIVMMFTTVCYGLFRHLTGGLHAVVDPPEMQAHGGATTVGLFLVLHAFASGTTALTGVEAISNGITAFKEPRSHNAGITLLWMSGILGTLFLLISYLAGPIGAVPSEQETIISQLVRTVFGGKGVMYSLTIWSTTIILVMAANTAFADFPRLSALHAGDGFLPRQLTYRGSRLVFSKGIVTLTVIACALIVAFQASVTLLIPLYAIGVFLSFTLSQAGMARRWWRCGRLKPGEEVVDPGSVLRYEPGWQHKMVVNGFGSFCTLIVMLVFAITKFKDGAWVVCLLTPILVAIFFQIHYHYKGLAAGLSLDHPEPLPPLGRHRVIVPVSGVHRGSLMALNYARSLSSDVTAVHVSLEPADAERLREKWDTWGMGTRLVILYSPYRVLLEPLLTYVNEIAALRQPNEIITVVVPQFVPEKWWHNMLHTQAAMLLRWALIYKRGVVVTDVPYHVKAAFTATHH